MEKHILSILCRNHAGVIYRIAALMFHRGVNIDSICAAETEHTDISRITLVVSCNEMTNEENKRQIMKVEETYDVMEMDTEGSIAREMVMVRFNRSVGQAGEINRFAEQWKAQKISLEPVVLLLCDEPARAETFLKQALSFGDVDMVRSGEVMMPV